MNLQYPFNYFTIRLTCLLKNESINNTPNIIIPLIASCAVTGIFINVKEVDMTPMMKTPKTIPEIFPFPPLRLTPPITAAAIASNCVVPEMLGATCSILQMVINAPRPVQTPANRNAKNL